MFSSKIKYFLYGSLATISLISVITYASNDGVFGIYFDRMIQDAGCGGDSVVTGFSTTNYGKQECKSIKDLISSYNIFNTTGNIGIGTSTPSAKLDVAGKIRMQDVTIDGDSGDIVVTKGYMESKLAALNMRITALENSTIAPVVIPPVAIPTAATPATVTVAPIETLPPVIVTGTFAGICGGDGFVDTEYYCGGVPGGAGWVSQSDGCYHRCLGNISGGTFAGICGGNGAVDTEWKCASPNFGGILGTPWVMQTNDCYHRCL